MKKQATKTTALVTAIDDAGLCKDKPPVLGAKAVYWLERDGHGLQWKHKGWLMPEVSDE